MGRHRTNISGLATGYRGGPRWSDPYHCEWSVVIGDRVRRLRNARGLFLWQMSQLVEKPNEGCYSAGYFSKIERGFASAPLYVYLAIADVFEVPPGRLLGPDDAQRSVTEAEMTLVGVIRRLGISADEAIVRVLRPPEELGLGNAPDGPNPRAA